MMAEQRYMAQTIHKCSIYVVLSILILFIVAVVGVFFTWAYGKLHVMFFVGRMATIALMIIFPIFVPLFKWLESRYRVEAYMNFYNR